MIAERFANLLLVAANFSLLCVVLFWCWRRYRIDALRDRLFLLRDELFDYALSSELSFGDPAYVMLRRSINSMLRFAHKISFTRTLLVAVLTYRVTNRDILSDYDREWEDALSGLENDEYRQKIKDLHEKVLLTVGQHMAIGAIPWMFVLLNVLLLNHFVQRCRAFILRKASIVEIEARYAERMPSVS